MASVKVTTSMSGVFNVDTNNDQLATVIQAVFDKQINACCIVPTTIFSGSSSFESTRYGSGFVAVCGKWLFHTQNGKSWIAKQVGSDNFICNLHDQTKRDQALQDFRHFEMAGLVIPAKKAAEVLVQVEKPVASAPPPPPYTRRPEPTQPVKPQFQRQFSPESIWPVVVGIVIVVCMCLFFGFVGRSNTPSTMESVMLLMVKQGDNQRLDRFAELQQQQEQRERDQREREAAREFRRKQHDADMELKRTQHAAEMEMRRQQDKADREERQSANVLTTYLQMMSLGDRSDYFLGGAPGPAALGPVRNNRVPASQEVATIPVQPQSRSTMDTIVYGIVIALGSLLVVWKCGQCLCPDVRADEYMEEEQPRYERAEQSQHYYQEEVRHPPVWQHTDKWGNTVHRLKGE